MEDITITNDWWNINMNNNQTNNTTNNDKFDALKLINMLNSMSDEDKNKTAKTSNIIQDELRKLFRETKILVTKQKREDAIKYALWQGLLNQYGIFGNKRNTHKTSFYDKIYKHGDLISIDFGTSNIGVEFSYTHTAIVLKNYTDYIVVIPTTSVKEHRLENKPKDEQNDTMVITSDDFDGIESDSYIMLYQVRSVSKNRIQKIIGNIGDTDLMKRINQKLVEIYLPYIVEECHNLTSIISDKDKIIKEKEIEILNLKEKLKESVDISQNKC